MTFSLETLEAIIARRAAAAPDESWTARLVVAGPARIAKKLGEEAVEAALAGACGSTEELTGEAADVLYHLLVLLHARAIPVSRVLAELERRTGQSGLAEKASRPAQ